MEYDFVGYMGERSIRSIVGRVRRIVGIGRWVLGVCVRGFDFVFSFISF